MRASRPTVFWLGNIGKTVANTNMPDTPDYDSNTPIFNYHAGKRGDIGVPDFLYKSNETARSGWVHRTKSMHICPCYQRAYEHDGMTI